MTAQAGDLIVVEAEPVAQPESRGVIEEALDEEQPRFRVRWDDGRTSVFTRPQGSESVERHRALGREPPCFIRGSYRVATRRRELDAR